MHLNPKINWTLVGRQNQDIDPVLFLLMKAIQREGSLQKSCQTVAMSYRHAWGIIKKWEKEFHSPLVILRRGRGQGATLSELGEKLLWADEYLEEQIRPGLNVVNEELNESLADYFQQGQRKRIKLFASHGLAISHLHQLLENEPSLEVELQTHGSLDSLQSLNNGHCQMAGFHLPLDHIHDEVLPLYKRWLPSGKYLLLTVSTREQGLMLKPGNPKNIKSLTDLSRRSIRFINRQRNSGTRTIIDQLLIMHRIKPRQINGYTNEEFTHGAVAAMIASGAADAGFGIKAIAQQFGLDFLPFLREIYLLAIDRELDNKTIKTIGTILKSQKFRRTVNKLAGYQASQAGKEYTLK